MVLNVTEVLLAIAVSVVWMEMLTIVNTMNVTIMKKQLMLIIVRITQGLIYTLSYASSNNQACFIKIIRFIYKSIKVDVRP